MPERRTTNAPFAQWCGPPSQPRDEPQGLVIDAVLELRRRMAGKAGRRGETIEIQAEMSSFFHLGCGSLQTAGEGLMVGGSDC